VNGVSAGTSGSSYSYIPVAGDVVSATLISNATCAAPDSAHASVTASVKTPVTPTVSITASPGMTIKTGQADTFSATVTNGGSSPTYQWNVNGHAMAGATLPTFIYAGFANGDIVSCTVTGGGFCPKQATSPASSITVTTSVGVGQAGIAGNTINVLPNPNKGAFTIKGSTGGINDERASIEINNMLGQVIFSDVLTVQNGEVNKEVLLGGKVANGMYILSLHSETCNKIFHIVIEQ